MAPIFRASPLEVLKGLAETMHDFPLFLRTKVAGKDQDPPFAGAWESVCEMDYRRFTLAHDFM